MDSGDLGPDTFFTTDGKDIWKLDSYYTGPSCTLKNIETGDTKTFGMRCTIAESFHRITIPHIVVDAILIDSLGSRSNKEKR